MKIPKRKEDIFLGISVVLLVLLAYFLSLTVFGVRLDRLISDRMYDGKSREEMVVVGIDDTALQSIGAWPWKRDVFASVIEQLYKQGARLVVFDILFLEEREGDMMLKKVLVDSKKDTVFAVKLDEEKKVLNTVYQGIGGVREGIAHVYPDDDGKVRTTQLFFKDNKGNCMPTLSYLAFSLYTKKDLGGCDLLPKRFLYQQDNAEVISVARVLEKQALPEINGKVVFIGSTSLDLEDHFVSLSGEKIPGVFVHASMFSTLLNNSFTQTAPLFAVLGSLLFFVFYGLFISLSFKKTGVQVVLFLFGCILVIAVSFFLYALGFWLPFAFMFLSYVLVSLYGFMFRYVRTERKNEHIRTLFGKYVHEDVLKELMESPKEVKLGGEKRDVTVLFSDIRGFTTFSETMSPEALTHLLNDYLSAMSPKILEQKGTIDKFIGDAIMAFWNAPLRIEKHTLHAVKAALGMVDGLKEFNTLHGSNLAVGIGLHTGEVVVGNIGSQDRINYTILGDVVNTGSRLEGLTKKYGIEILASKEVHDKVQDNTIVFRKLDVITVKGKNEPTIIYEVRKREDFASGVVDTYEKALDLYIQGDFDGALSLFKKLASEGDGPSQKMIEKIPTIDRATWTGVWRFDEK